MNRRGTVQIQVDAAKALAGWKAYFAEQVALKAKELARRNSAAELVTLTHDRKAAIAAAQSILGRTAGHGIKR